jgi:hypothetical protein
MIGARYAAKPASGVQNSCALDLNHCRSLTLPTAIFSHESSNDEDRPLFVIRNLPTCHSRLVTRLDISLVYIYLVAFHYLSHTSNSLTGAPRLWTRLLSLVSTTHLATRIGQILKLFPHAKTHLCCRKARAPQIKSQHLRGLTHSLSRAHFVSRA